MADLTPGSYRLYHCLIVESLGTRLANGQRNWCYPLLLLIDVYRQIPYPWKEFEQIENSVAKLLCFEDELVVI